MKYRYITNSEQIVVWTEERGIIGWVVFGTKVQVYIPGNPYVINGRLSVSEALNSIWNFDKFRSYFLNRYELDRS